MLFACTLAVIIDGDTLTCADGRTVRLWGLDAPEMSEAGGETARASLAALARAGDALSCERRGAPSFGRTVARCLTADGDDLACMMIHRGAAQEWVRFSGGFYRTCRP